MDIFLWFTRYLAFFRYSLCSSALSILLRVSDYNFKFYSGYDFYLCYLSTQYFGFPSSLHTVFDPVLTL